MKNQKKRLISLLLACIMIMSMIPQGVVFAGNTALGEEISTMKADSEVTTKTFATTYADPGNNRNWREGMVTGNGKNGVVTSGSPYADTLIYQNMYFIMPSNAIRENTSVLASHVAPARTAVFNLDSNAAANSLPNSRSFFYTFHPSHQLRLTMDSKTYSNYQRWTDFETAEVGVNYTDTNGDWERRTFTSRADDVTITEIKQSSTGAKVNMTLSIDNPSSMYKFNNSGDNTSMRYKKLVADNADYIVEVAHYPSYTNSELKDGGFAGLTRVIVVNGTKEKITSTTAGTGTSKDSQNVGSEANPAIKITDADAVYLITQSDRTHTMGAIGNFAGASSYPLVDGLATYTKNVADKYIVDGKFNYDAAIAPHLALHSTEFNKVKFSLDADPADRELSNNDLLTKQRANKANLSTAVVERAYNAGRYAELTSSGYMTPRLGGMWTGEWVPGWRSIFTMDANVNLQVSPMNTGNMETASVGFIYFVLRQIDDWMKNAKDTFGMHDALQVPVNTDGDRALQIETDRSYPFEFWHAGASWMLLPIYEYWQCYGNQQIKLDDDLYNFDKITKALGVNDGGLTQQEIDEIKARGWLDLEKDILLPLLTKQANYWEQLCTPTYYMDVNGNRQYQANKTQLNPGERYLFLPTYSPENSPKGYTSTITLNATMDISAARDGLNMTIEMEKAVNRPGKDAAIARWEDLLTKIPAYEFDGEPGILTNDGGGGALREWATKDYIENNNHRHLSHLYVAWPAYETRNDEALYAAAKQALANRNRLNTGDDTTGHGWMHKALVAARLNDGYEVEKSLRTVLTSNMYYNSFISDHNTDRGSDTYCTDTSIGMVGVVNEALVFSNTGQIEILPALPIKWTSGHINGLMARTRAEVEKLSWDVATGKTDVEIRSDIDQTIKLTYGKKWRSAVVTGEGSAVVTNGDKIMLTLKAGEVAKIQFTDLVDTSELDAMIAKAENYDEVLYTPSSYLKLLQAIAEGKAVSESETSSSIDVLNAIDKIQAAINDLIRAADAGPIVNYDMTLTTDGKLKDITGGGYDAAMVGLTSANITTSDGIKFLNFSANNSSNNSYVKLPNDIIKGENFTIDMTFKISTRANEALLSLGTGFVSWPNCNYVRLHPNTSEGPQWEILLNNVGAKQSNAALPANAFNKVTAVFKENGTMDYYLNGKFVNTINHGQKIQDILAANHNPADCLGYIGRPAWNGDPYFSGQLSGFKVYDTAMTAGEITYNINRDAAILKLKNYLKDISVNETKYTSQSYGDFLQAFDIAKDAVKDTSHYSLDEINEAYDKLVFAFENLVLKGIVVEYDMSRTTDGKLQDITGNGFNAEMNNITETQFVTDGGRTVLDFGTNNANRYVKLPNDIIKGEDFSIEMTFKRSNRTNEGLLTLGTGFTSWPDCNYVRFHPYNSTTTDFWEILLGNNGDKATPAAMPANSYNKVTAVFKADGTMEYYLNGKLISTLTHGKKIQDILAANHNPADCLGYLGRPAWSGDPYFSGQLASFKVFNYSLTAQEISGEQGIDVSILKTTIDDADLIEAQADLYENNSDWIAFVSKLNEAKGVFANPESQSQVDTIISELKAAMATLSLIVPSDGLILDLNFDNSDMSSTVGKATAVGTITYAKGVSGRAAVFNGNASNYIRLNATDGTSPLLSGLTQYSVSFWVKNGAKSWWWYAAPDATAPTYRYEKYVGVLAEGSNLTYQRYNNDGSRTTDTNATGFPANTWTHVIVTNSTDSSSVYFNGVLSATQSSSIDVNTMLGSSSIAYIGRANWVSGEPATGLIDDYKVYNRVVTATEIAELYAEHSPVDPLDITSVSCVGERTKQIEYDHEKRVITLPVFPGTDLKNLPLTIGYNTDLTTISPDPATITDYSSPVKFTTSEKASGDKAEYTINAVVYGNQVLPEPHADPQVMEYNGKYYIYSTTDGEPGWGGYYFECWSSDDLVTWENEGIILDLKASEPYKNIKGVDVGTVSWANGNAWAPAIIERDGVFYYYFSGHNPGLNAKVIGVATSTSPTGPFVAEPNYLFRQSDGYSGQAIDPCVFKDPVSGDYFIYWGQGPRYLTAFKLNADMKSVEAASKTRIDTGSSNVFNEGIYVIYNEAGNPNGNYYFMYSQNDTGDENYQVRYGVTNNPLGSNPRSGSSNSSITGNTIVLQKDVSKKILATGHHSVLNVPGTNRWYAVYHRFQRTGGNGYTREVCIDEMKFDSKGAIQKIIPTLEGILKPVKVGDATLDLRDAADALTLFGIDDVRHSITMPVKGEYGTTITWKSSNPDIITDTVVDGKAPGVVTRPVGGASIVVTLTATLTDLKGQTMEKEFKATVTPIDPNLDTDYSAGYLWTYFNASSLMPSGSTGTTNNRYKIFYGFSKDGLHWNTINKKSGTQYPIAESVVGYTGVRDPHVIRSVEGDKYWILGTDLQDGFDTTTGSKSLIVWESNDLINWTESRLEMVFSTAGNVWAPEAIYDEASGDYLVYWASSDQSQTGNAVALRQYVSRTRDFHTFTEPVLWANEHDNTSSKKNCIDASLAYVNGNYYRFMTSDWNTVVDYSPTLSTNMSDWTKIMTRGTHANFGLESVEGFTVYQLPDGRWCAMGDNNAYRGYYIENDDFHTQKWTKLATSGTNSRSNTFDATFRHGTVMRLSATEEKALMVAYGEGYDYDPATHYSVYVKNGTSNPLVSTAGKNVTVNYVTPATGTFQHWSAEGIELTETQKTSTSLTFAMPTNDVRLIAVLNVAATGIELNSKNLTLTTGAEYVLSATVKPIDTIQSVTWTSDDESVAKVDENGRVTAIKAGTATITAKSTITNSVSATCVVTVSPVVAKNISIDSRVKIVVDRIPDEGSAVFDPLIHVTANEDISLRIIYAEYDANGVLLNCSDYASDIHATLYAGSEGTFEVSIPRSEKGVTYKFFIWDSNFLPLTSITTIAGL